MKDERIISAFDRAAPDEAAVGRMLEGIKAKTAERGAETARPARLRLRRTVLIAACTAAIAALSVTGYAAYKRWTLPAPETYPETENGGIIREISSADHSAPERDGDYAPLSDEEFILAAQSLLETVGVPDVSAERMTVRRQENMYWDRREAEVDFERGSATVSVRFNAETGAFLGFFDLDQIGSAPASAPDAEAAARAYYAKLPVPQGYKLTASENHDEHWRSFEFCREVQPGLYSAYEAVRVAVDPADGRLVGCTVFFVPLLDDHAEGEQPISAEAADAAVRASGALKSEGYGLISSELAVGLPNWRFTENDTSNARASGVTRLCRKMVYERPNETFTDKIEVMVDLYTGEILGGDMMK